MFFNGIGNGYDADDSLITGKEHRSLSLLLKGTHTLFKTGRLDSADLHQPSIAEKDLIAFV